MKRIKESKKKMCRRDAISFLLLLFFHLFIHHDTLYYIFRAFLVNYLFDQF